MKEPIYQRLEMPRCKKHKIPVGWESRPGGHAVAVCSLCGGEADAEFWYSESTPESKDE